ncbi:60S ribosomal export protein NMD3 [Candidatus Halobonum tyrrellensis]|uniref:NMD3 family protein n=1 Tax=Candidatus Halobonum tyrrellensis G22 TaxID=1324957 RepID=V4HAL8_9EURY|nr:60S ribosomal export protein NMD3 [Candidatus Halobonum tyrrellensis]ESP87750.1 NMD3 family protein [Candidatus Halobonum tyrrellensis G22]
MSGTRGSGEFCPRCGDPVPEREEPLPGEPRERDRVLCDACYFDDFELVDAPDRIEVTVCGSCGAVHRGNRWVDVGARDYTDVAVDEVSEALGVHLNAEEVRWGVEPEQVDQNTIRMHCTFAGVVRGVAVEEEVVVPVKIGRGTCDRCGRVAGGSYAATVQVRGRGRTPDPAEEREAVEIAQELVADREADGDRDAFITEITDQPEGKDIKLSTNQLGKAVATRITDRLGGNYTEAPTLVTEDGDGNEVYRVTFALRLPKFRPGDLIDPDDGDGPVLVRSVQGNLKGVRVTTGEAYEAEFEAGETPDAETVGEADDATETTVVAVEDDHAVQVLDPETFESTTVPRPDYFDPADDAVPVIKTRTGLYVLPDGSGD